MKKTAILTILSFFGSKNKPICSINENNAGKEIYDLEEATCFIALKLQKKKSDLSVIRDALLAEMNYMDKIGLNSENETPPDVELDVDQMVEYVLNEENVNLTKEQLLEIFDTEIEYLIFIGVASE